MVLVITRSSFRSFYELEMFGHKACDGVTDRPVFQVGMEPRPADSEDAIKITLFIRQGPVIQIGGIPGISAVSLLVNFHKLDLLLR